VLIEHYAGAFPLWLAPVQAVVIPVGERHQEYARSVAEALKSRGVRVHVDDRAEKMNYKIREAQVQKVPYMLVVGDKEVEARNASVRHRQAGDLGPMAIEAVAEKIARLAASRSTSEEAPSARPAGGGS
jgi:threonyl-tRNA synthetase